MASLLSTDQLAHDARLVRLNDADFGRAPDQGGFAHWSQQLASGRGLIVVANHFAASSEFRSTYGVLDDAAFADSSENVRTKTPLVDVFRAIRALRRAFPANAEVQALAGPALDGSGTVLDAIRAIRTSPAYAARF